MAIVGRNDRCPCGSGKKFKKCCLLSASNDDMARMLSAKKLKERVQGREMFEDGKPLFIQDPKGTKKMSEIILAGHLNLPFATPGLLEPTSLRKFNFHKSSST